MLILILIDDNLDANQDKGVFLHVLVLEISQIPKELHGSTGTSNVSRPLPSLGLCVVAAGLLSPITSLWLFWHSHEARERQA